MDDKILLSMSDAIWHRGPDACGSFMDDGVALAHRRLSILDLSEAGNQPMHSQSGRYVMVYNGEIYNYLELRKELECEGMSFRTTTDTEVILALYERDSVAFLDRLNGMFALAIWDKYEARLFLARDRLGKKPLYYGSVGGNFAFASELKAIMQLPKFETNVRLDAVKDYFFYQYVPDPKTIFTSIHKLEPGHWMLVDESGITYRQYWDVSFSSNNGGSIEKIESELLELIEDSVKLRMVSDVPLGAFLSGGIDSSAIVGLMAKNSNSPITSCSIGFDSEKYDEVVYARQVAEQFHTDHHEFVVRENVEDNLLRIASYFDEPFSDPSFVPTFFVSQLAKQQVTVALAGDGGDENFAGYSKYVIDQVENTIRSYVPEIIRQSFMPPMSRLLAGTTNRLLKKGSSLFTALSEEPARSFFITNSVFDEVVWNKLVSGRLSTETSGYDPAEVSCRFYNSADTDDHLSKVLYTDMKTYLPGDILVKVDRMSMANSLETRAPLLDYRVVEYAASIPSNLKLNNKEKKYILKKSLEGFLTDDILYRRKMGFSVPLREWLQCEIYRIAQKYLFNPKSGISEFFNISVLREIWEHHQQGIRDYSSELWGMLIFELWWQNYIEGSALAASE